MEIERVTLHNRDRQLTSNWTINNEQELEALYGTDVIKQLYNDMANQMALEIDREILETFLTTSTNKERCVLYNLLDIDNPKIYRDEILIKKYGFK